jgi:hypothetical protein
MNNCSFLNGMIKYYEVMLLLPCPYHLYYLVTKLFVSNKL